MLVKPEDLEMRPWITFRNNCEKGTLLDSLLNPSQPIPQGVTASRGLSTGPACP
jgi:hypothetical protein